MQVGDLVLIGPNYDGHTCIIVDTSAQNEAGPLPECVTIHIPHNGYTIPMNKKWIKVISTNQYHRGGTGRHNGLKIRCSVEREGSSPSDGTKKVKKHLTNS